MEEIKLGTKIRILKVGEQKPMKAEGEIATIREPPARWRSNSTALRDAYGDYWADFSGQGNKYVYGDGIWCVGTPGRFFEIMEETV